jgi:hypothetical protein
LRKEKDFPVKVNMPRTQRTKKELQKASDHLHYELWMLKSVANILTGDRTDVVINNALLESFSIHARVLLDFLYDDVPRNDDMNAIDYCSEWTGIRPEKSNLLGKLHLRVGKEVAHLTYARLQVSPDLRGWAFLEIANEISKIMKAFICGVPKDRLSEKWAG